jgi:adenylate cyclase
MTDRHAPESTDTILFTDLVGFTEYTDACGDSAAVAVLDQQSTIARDALADGRGRLVKEIGDGLMFWFQHPDDALRAAISVLGAVDTAREHHGFPLGIRMGMHCGEVTARGDDFVGQTVNIASRVSDLAGPGELVASEAVVGSVGSVYGRFEPVGPARVRGVAAPIWLHRLVPVHSRRSRLRP